MYDLIIIGAGSAGLPAAMYAARYTLKTLVVGQLIGGTLTEAFQVDNYPGLPGLSGLEIMNRFKDHSEKLGAEIKPGKVTSITKQTSDQGEVFTVTTEDGRSWQGKTVMLAIGNEKRKLNVPGEKEFAGRGVVYCAVCDAAFFKNKTVVVAGGGDSGVEAAVLLSDYAKKIYVISRDKNLRAEPIWLNSLKTKTMVEVVPENEIVEIKGQTIVTEVVLKNPYNGSQTLPTEGVFVEVGAQPNKELPTQLGVAVDERGYIKVDQNMQTSVPGVFAAGDNTVGFYSLRQTIVAAAAGVIGATSVYNYLLAKK